MADLARDFPRIQKVRLHRGPVSIMARSALLEDCRFVSVDLREPRRLMTVETAALENEAPPRIEPVALRALDSRNRRMLMKRLVTGRGIRAHEEPHFFPAALPRQNQRM